MPKSAKARKSIPLSQKVAIIEEWEASDGSKYVVAKKYGISAGQITRWVRNKTKLLARAERNPNSFSIHTGPAVTNPTVEEKLIEYYKERQKEGVAVDTSMLMARALEIDPGFHGGSKSLRYWVYQFIIRHDLKVARSKRNTHPKLIESTKRTISRAKVPNSPAAKPVVQAEDGCAQACRQAQELRQSLGDQYYAALDLLAQAQVAHTFNVIPPEDRLGWLQWKLQQNTKPPVEV
ncbi:hypothetical protein LEN26_008203 [Aphanomyces euteiches]|nr:hypothetical protein AeMF1_012622 [Aphanomyces euteiches]KAH9130782.1 hypothetical protein LEN26_008203 [Aphanomyces euteiches]KAH9187680.1 hypothetical protein AeNC1_010348 [Aphanomyces euteiches]